MLAYAYMFPTSYIPERFKSYLPFVPTIALAFGFFFDVLTLNRPDALFENIVIVGYLLLSAIVMILLQARTDESSERKRLILLSLLQFSFGNLASALMILYAHSGTFAGSAIFVAILASLLLGNELLKQRYARTYLRVVIWFVLLLTYSGLAVPIIIGKIGGWVFITSVLGAFLVTHVLNRILAHVSRESFSRTRRNIGITIVGISIVFSGLYFTNLIPPVPLSLKHVGIYHSVERTGDTYALAYEAPQWFEFWRDTNATFNKESSAPAFCFSSVFAPSTLQTEIRHRWEKYDVAKEEWETIARIPFPIAGGRENGFRGYTQTSQVDDGLWRCSVETSRGALIGRTSFTVGTEIPKLESIEF